MKPKDLNRFTYSDEITNDSWSMFLCGQCFGTDFVKVKDPGTLL